MMPDGTTFSGKASFVPPPQSAPRGVPFGKLVVFSVADIDTAQPRSYLLKGLISPNEISLWVGPPKCGKSFLMLYIAYMLSFGRPVFGRRVKPTRVLYVAAEGEGGINNRIEALRRAHGDSPNFCFIAQPVDLLHPAGNLADLKLAAAGRDLVIIDTLSRALAGGDENSSQDMGTLVAHITELRHDTNAHIAAVHHGTKASNGSNPRGHSCLTGADDALVEVTKDEATGIRTARVVHAKDDADGYALTFRLEPVNLGTDDDNDPITTLIVHEEAAAAAKEKGSPLSDNDKIALRCLDATFRAEAILATVGDDNRERPVIREENWRKRFYAEGKPGEAQDAKRMAFKRAVSRLLAAGKISSRDDLIWRPDAW